MKFKANRTLERYKAKIITKWLYANLWSGLSRYLYFSNKDEYSKNYFILRCLHRIGALTI